MEHREPVDGAVPRDRVELTVPADPAYLAVLRTASAGLAARLDLTLDEIEDLRIAVDEACAMLLNRPRARDGHDGATLAAVFDLSRDALQVEVRGPAAQLPERSSFAWTVLEALVGQVWTGRSGTGSFIRLRHERVRWAS